MYHNVRHWRQLAVICIGISLAILAGSAALASPTPVTFGTPTVMNIPNISAPFVTDLDGDGHLDIVVLLQTGLTVFYGHGDGTFTQVNYPNINLGYPLTFADFFGDGHLSIAGANSGDNGVVIVRNLGNRTFSQAGTYTFGSKLYGLCAGVFKTGGLPSIAAADNTGYMWVLPNNGDGTFGTPVSQSTGGYPKDIKAVDLAGNGILDIVMSNHYDTNAFIFYGDGNGNFPTTGSVPVGGGDLVVSDFNLDGKVDLAGCDYWGGHLGVALGNGAGGFSKTFQYSTPGYPSEISAGDLNGDGYPDLAIGHQGSSDFSIWLNDGTGNMIEQGTFSTPGSDVHNAIIADFQENGQPDVVVDGWTDHLSIYWNTTHPAPAITSLSPATVTPGHAGFPLTITGSNFNSKTAVYFGNDPLTITSVSATLIKATVPASEVLRAREASITAVNPKPGGGSASAAFIVAASGAGTHSRFDFNGDLKDDLLWQNDATGQLVLWDMNGENIDSETGIFAVVPPAWQVKGVADINNDGHPDLLWWNSATGQMLFWEMTGAQGTTKLVDGSMFGTASPNWEPVSMADFNGDGRPDILFQNTKTYQLVIWYMTGLTTHTSSGIITSPPVGWRVAGTADFNQDGHPDILFENVKTGELVIWYMTGATGTEIGKAGPVFATAPPPWEVVSTGDLDGDGHPDITWHNTKTGQVVVWLMTGDTGTTVKSYGGILPVAPPATWSIEGVR